MKGQDRIAKEKELDKEDEFDLISLVKTIWDGRRPIILTIIIFTLFGLVVALLCKKEYTASTIMVPQIKNQSSDLGGLSSLASLAGFNMDINSGVNDISPKLYPMIVSSAKFQLEIMNAEYLFDEVERPISLMDYYLNEYKPGLFGYLKKYTIGLPGLILSSIRGEQIDQGINTNSKIIRLSQDQEKVRKIIDKNLHLEINDDEGYLKLVSRFPQAYLSVQVAQKAQELLQKYVTQFKIEKATSQMLFIKGRYEEKKEEFEKSQSHLATFRDANKNISSEIARTQEERLQNEYQLAFEVYSELAKQLEQAMIKVQEDTPVFSVIKELVVPIEKSKPKRALILFVWFFLGVVIGIGWIIGQSIFTSSKSKCDKVEFQT